MSRLLLLRIFAVGTVILGLNYLAWRWVFSLNWHAWWIAVPLVVAETYSLIDVCLFGLTMWNARTRPAPPNAPAGLTVDVFITTYNETVALVVETAVAAQRIRYPHTTWILDDGARTEMQDAAADLGVGYIKRSANWKNRPLHAKAGNLNNALMATDGEFLLILDADQVPRPEILDRTLGYFDDPKIALVQTPQIFGNVSPGDPLGSQAPLFYGPIQQGKDGWNAAFFCGSNAILRREALMQLGISRYVSELERAIQTALRGADRVLNQASRTTGARDPQVRLALAEVSGAIDQTRNELAAGASLGQATYQLQQRLTAYSREMVANDIHLLKMDLEAIREMRIDTDESWDVLIDVDQTVSALAARDLSPLGALESVRALLRSVDVDRDHEAQPLMPLATISVTEDMATSMRLHGLGWRSAYHHELLAIGLAPEDLGAMLQQRLRWGQGTVQVLLKENPLVQQGLSIAQRLMYFATMWSYLGGFAAIVYFASPVVYLCFGILPVHTAAGAFFIRFVPFIIANQLLFYVAGRGISTWRGQQYSLALFPIWLRSITTAVANVVFHRPLGFVVTPKTRQGGTNQWKLIRPQLAVGIVLLVAACVGIIRLVMGVGNPLGTAVNLFWVVVDVAILSVVIPAVRYQGYQVEEVSP
jgi:cellulose synthase (UDP-forming)